MNPSETAALEFARSLVATLNDEKVDLGNGQLSLLRKEDNRRFVRAMLKDWASAAPNNMIAVADWARGGWPVADEALKELAVEYWQRDEKPPTYLTAYMMEVTSAAHRRAPAQMKADYVLRDLAIVIIVHETCERFGLKPFGRSARKRCGCAIVGIALGEANMQMSYKNVAAIWNKYGKRCFPYS